MDAPSTAAGTAAAARPAETDAPRTTALDRVYSALVLRVIERGARKPSRKVSAGQPVHTRSLTAEQIRVKLPTCTTLPDHSVKVNGFPQMMYKWVQIPKVAEELAWFLRGETNAASLREHGCGIWMHDAAQAQKRGGFAPGDLGPIYGFQWRRHPAGDQIRQMGLKLAADPYSRDNLVCSWDLGQLDKMALKPCHYAFQLVCQPAEDGVQVDCVVSMRSTDVGLGLPFNIASYALLTTLFIVEANRFTRGRFSPGELIITMADCHIYEPHVAALETAARAAAAAAAAEDAAGVAASAGADFVLSTQIQTIDQFAIAGSRARKAAFEKPEPPGAHVPLPLFT